MKNFLLSLLLLSSALFMPLSCQQASTERFIRQQMESYPESRLLDLYKSSFQDFMGPEHLVRDSSMAAAYLEKELSGMDTLSSKVSPLTFEPCGPKGRYIRVGLSLVKDGSVPEDVLLSCFLESARGKKPDLGKWKKEWTRIEREIEKTGITLPGFDKDKRDIEEVLSSGHYALSHSPEYRKAYSPHYRIVRRDIFRKRIEPLLKERER